MKQSSSLPPDAPRSTGKMAILKAASFPPIKQQGLLEIMEVVSPPESEERSGETPVGTEGSEQEEPS